MPLLNLVELVALYLEEHPTAAYAAEVLQNVRSLSGADLKGKAASYAGHYYKQRAKVCAWLARKVEEGATQAHIRKTRKGKYEFVAGEAPFDGALEVVGPSAWGHAVVVLGAPKTLKTYKY